GRTHQIRVHLTRLGHPLLGDQVYGTGYKSKESQLGEDARRGLARLKRQALHAYQLGFEHPVTKKAVLFESPLPADLQKLADALNNPMEPVPFRGARRSYMDRLWSAVQRPYGRACLK